MRRLSRAEVRNRSWTTAWWSGRAADRVGPGLELFSRAEAPDRRLGRCVARRLPDRPDGFRAGNDDAALQRGRSNARPDHRRAEAQTLKRGGCLAQLRDLQAVRLRPV